MAKLFVEKSIEINAPASKVWEALTNRGLTKKWIREWWPDLVVLESDWKAGSPVLWKVADGIIGAEGKVSVVEPYTMLRFSFIVNDTNTSRRVDITYRLGERYGHTILLVSVGDFGDTPEHEMCYPGAVESWDKSLPKIKELAEK